MFALPLPTHGQDGVQSLNRLVPETNGIATGLAVIHLQWKTLPWPVVG